MKSYLSVVKRELTEIIGKNDWLKALTLWLPLPFFILIWAIFSSGLPSNFSIATLDYDKSALTRNLSRQIDGAPNFKINYVVSDLQQALSLVRSGEVYAIVIFPAHLERDVKRQASPAVTVYYNTQYLLSGQLIASGLQKIIGTNNIQFETAKNLAANHTIEQANKKTLPFKNQIDALYNEARNYIPFLVALIIPVIWQIFIIISIIASFGIEKRNKTLKSWAASSNNLGIAWLGKLTPYFVIFSIYGAIYLIGFNGFLKWNIAGNLFILLLAQWLMVATYLILGSLFFSITFDYARATSLATVYVAPALAFAGITFPAASMSNFAKMWSSLLPVTHYLKIQIQQTNYAAPWSVSIYSIGALCVFLLITPITLFIMNKKISLHNELSQQ